MGNFGRERIVGDLRMSVRHPAQQRRFAGVGQADETGVGDDLQLQHDPALFAGRAGLRLARGTVGRGNEGVVAATAATALGDDDLVTVLLEVAQDVAAIAVADDGARRHGNEELVSLAAVAVGRLALAAAFGPPVLAIDDVGEAVGAGDRTDNDVAAVAAIAAVGAALGHILLAPEATAARAAVAALDVNRHPIHEYHGDTNHPKNISPPPAERRCGDGPLGI